MNTNRLRENLTSLSLLLFRDLSLIVVLLLALEAINTVGLDALRTVTGAGNLLKVMERWIEIAYPSFIAASTVLFLMESVAVLVKSYYTKLSKESVKRTLLSLRSFVEATLSYLGVFFGATFGYALVQEAVNTHRGLAAKFCFYTAGFVLLLEVILLGIRYAYHIAGQWTVPEEVVVA
jgi:hypothetical protein